MRLLLFLGLALLPACSSEPLVSEPLTEQAAETAGSRDPPEPPRSRPPAAASLPGLLPLGEREILAALGSGASCSLSDGGPPLMVAMPGKAVANDRGRLVALASPAKGWNALLEGGRFSNADLAIEVDPGAIVASEDGGIARDASVSIVRDGRGYSVSHGPRWTCGA